jgi:ubiquitin C-terminal hydrolase
LDKKYENVNPNFYLEYKELLIKACRIKDFLLVKTKPIKPLEKDFTEFGQEYYNNYELINKNIYQLFKEAFGSYELNEVREFKVNIIKKRGIIINFNHEQIEVNKMYMYNENKNLKPERYLIVLSNSKYMNFRVKRPLEENGIDEGLKLIPTEQNEEDDEEYFKIKLNNEIIGSLINITNPINRTFGNFIPSKPCLKGLEKNDIIYSMNSVIQCLNNIPPLIGYFLNKKRMIQIYNTKETKPLSNKILEIFKELWLNDNEESGIISCKDVSDYLLELNPFFSGNDSNAKELLYYIINLVHQELNKIENINHYLVNDKIKFNYQLCFENYYNYYKSNYKSIISDIFYGFKNDTLTCSKCSNTSHSINLYDILIFPTDEIKNFKNYSSDSILIEECFEYNERKIDLYNCRNYLCNFCNNYANGVLTTKLVLLPKILIVAFDRKEEKDFNVKVNFDEFLDLRKFVFYDSKIYKYELIGVIKNINKFNEIKKYIAFCKSCANKNWYLYDDMNVTKADFKDVKEIGNVDILIYNNFVYNK